MSATYPHARVEHLRTATVPLAFAPKYAAAGHPCLPVQPHAKSPLAELVPHGLRDATTDPEVLADWLRRAPDANIAIRCDGLIVLDVDPGGEESLAELAKAEIPIRHDAVVVRHIQEVSDRVNRVVLQLERTSNRLAI